MNNAIPSSDEWIGQESTSDATMYDSKVGPGKEEEMASPHRINHHCL